jgi:entericidin B
MQSDSGNKLYKGLLLALVVGAAALALPACETTEGAGRDIEKAGDKIEDMADDAKD